VGDPGYLLTAVSAQNKLLCLKNLPLKFALVRDMKPIDTRPATNPVYGYSSDCLPEGLVFQSAPGSTVTIRIVVTPHSTALPQGDLTVIPYWTGEMKDRLVGISLSQTFRPICRVLAIFGVTALLAAAYILLGQIAKIQRATRV